MIFFENITQEISMIKVVLSHKIKEIILLVTKVLKVKVVSECRDQEIDQFKTLTEHSAQRYSIQMSKIHMIHLLVNWGFQKTVKCIEAVAQHDLQSHNMKMYQRTEI